MEAGAARPRSAIAWMAAALVLVVIAGVVYLRPGAAGASVQPAAVRQLTGPSSESLVNLSFADARRGSVTVDRQAQGLHKAEAYVTADGGATWKRAAPLTYLTARMVIQHAQSTPGAERISSDGGRTWRVLSMPGSSSPALGMPDFADAAHGWWVVQGLGDPPSVTTVWRTDDGGRTWQPLPRIGIPEADTLTQMRFLDPLRGVLMARAPDGTPSLFVTDNGGLAWRPVVTLSSPMPGTRPSVAALLARGASLLVWMTAVTDAYNQSSTVRTYVTESGDDGLTWSPPRPGPSLEPTVGAPALDDRGRLLLLNDRRLWMSPDGGLTWTARVIEAPAGLLAFGPLLAGGTLLAWASDGSTIGTLRPVYRLLRSTDGGAQWDLVRLP